MFIELSRELLDYANTIVAKSLQANYKDKFATSDSPKAAQKLRLTGFLGEIAASVYLGLPLPTDCYGRKGQDSGKDFEYKGYNLDVKTTMVKADGERPIFLLPKRTIINQRTLTDFYFFVGLQLHKDGARAYLYGTANFQFVKSGFLGRDVSRGQTVSTETATRIAFEPCKLLGLADLQPLRNIPSQPAKND